MKSLKDRTKSLMLVIELDEGRRKGRRETEREGRKGGGVRTRAEGAVEVLEDDAPAERAGGMWVVHVVEARGQVADATLLRLRRGGREVRGRGRRTR